MKVFIYTYFIFLFISSSKAEFFDFGSMSKKSDVVPVFYQQEHIFSLEGSLYQKQKRRLAREEDELNVKKWRKDRVLNNLKKSKIQENAEGKNELILGRIISVRGKGYVYRNSGKIAGVKNGIVRSGDLVETSENGHLWLTLIDGSLIRLSPRTIFSVEGFEASRSKLVLFHRVNSGNVNWISRPKGAESSRSSNETDRVFYPFLDTLDLVLFSNYSKKEGIDGDWNIHIGKYSYLNSLKKSAEGIIDRLTVEHVLNTPHLIMDFIRGDFEIVVDFRGKDFVKVKFLESAQVYKKNTKKLNSIEIPENGRWMEISLGNFEQAEHGLEAWMGDYVKEDIVSLSILRERFLLNHSSKFIYSSKENSFWDRMLVSENVLEERKKFLLNYYNKKGGSFINDRQVFLKKNNYDPFSLSDYPNVYYSYSNYFNRVFSERNFRLKFYRGKDFFNQIVNYNQQFDEVFQQAGQNE